MLTITLLHTSQSRSYGRVVQNIVQQASRKLRARGEVGVSFISDAKMRQLNRTYRGKDKTTNVLSFATGERNDLGDIFISLSVAKKEAKQYGWTTKYAVARLALHGFLHLLGYDHVKDNEAEVMEKIEKTLLAKKYYDKHSSPFQKL